MYTLPYFTHISSMLSCYTEHQSCSNGVFPLNLKVFFVCFLHYWPAMKAVDWMNKVILKRVKVAIYRFVTWIFSL